MNEERDQQSGSELESVMPELLRASENAAWGLQCTDRRRSDGFRSRQFILDPRDPHAFLNELGATLRTAICVEGASKSRSSAGRRDAGRSPPIALTLAVAVIPRPGLGPMSCLIGVSY